MSAALPNFETMTLSHHQILFRLATGVAVVCAVITSSAQEVERDLMFVPVDEARPQGAQFRQGGGSMSLPFFDDFASPTFAAEAGPEALVRWTDASARRTSTYALDAPTVGQATLDGLRADGYPYAFNPDATGWADTLTSVPINLMGRTPEDDIHLMFFYQGGGRGNAPDENDSLVVEFLAPDGGEFGWSQVWSALGAEMDTFAFASIHVDQLIHLQDGFRFRFRNHGALAGNVDLWHLDYVLLDDNLDPESFQFFEVAFTEPRHALTEPYSIMPWTHFLSDPGGYMRDTMQTMHRNMSLIQADNVTCGLKVRNVQTNEVVDMLNPYSLTSVSQQSVFDVGYYIQEPLIENGDTLVLASQFAFSHPGNDTAATFEVSLYENPIGILEQERVGIPDNDSIVFTQAFRNEYAYDDGSAEKAYGLTIGGGKLAMRYDLAVPDTLYGLAIHFTPYYDEQADLNFLLRAWEDDGGQPGEELGEHYAFHQPAYFTDGADVFAYYAYDDPIAVEGAVHVGIVQESEFSLNIGLDKNTDYNYSRLHYQLGLGAEWTLSTIEGTVMIRPVLQAGVEEVFLSAEDVLESTGGSSALRAWPNPVSDRLKLTPSLDFEPVTIRCLDMMGREVLMAAWPKGASSAVVSLGLLPRGTLLVVLENVRGDRMMERILLR